MSKDTETLSVYAEKAREYAEVTREDNPFLAPFLAKLPPGGRVLDLGCGPGHHAAAMQAAGMQVTAWDASDEFAAVARDLHGLDVRVATFDDLDARAKFDGIWASFSLLHAPRADLPRHLQAIHAALRPGGALHLGMKTGRGEKRDALGRRYAYFSQVELSDLLDQTGFSLEMTETGKDIGLDGTVAPWVVIHARA